MENYKSPNHFELAFIGAGISSAYTILNYISIIRENRPEKPVQIAVIEQSGEFWTGIPYGKKTGANPLLITSLKEFIAQEDERMHFSNWLSENKDQVFSSLIPIKGKLMNKWWISHQAEIKNGDWDDIFIPRRAFGLYLQSEVNNEIQKAEDQGLIHCTLITASVQKIENQDGFYEISLLGDGQIQNTIWANKPILAVGSPPNFSSWKDHEKLENSHIEYIQNVYEPSMDETLKKVKNAVSQVDSGKKREVLIIGSNASTLDTLFTFCNEETPENRVDHFYIISPNAAFPHRISEKMERVAYQPNHLLNLAKTERFQAADILIAVKNEVQAALEAGFNISDVFPEISKGMISCLDLLTVEEQKRFVAKESIEIGKMQRRAGYEYLSVVNELKAQGRLTMIKGRYSKFAGFENDLAIFEFTNPKTGEVEILKKSIQVVINCAGFQDLSVPPAGLIQNLISAGICQANESKRGFLINENFETTPNFYVMGPLVAGNVNKRLRVWHAESCTRIISLSKQLAEVLVA